MLVGFRETMSSSYNEDDPSPFILFENWWAWPGLAVAIQGQAPDSTDAACKDKRPATKILLADPLADELMIPKGARAPVSTPV